MKTPLNHQFPLCDDIIISSQMQFIIVLATVFVLAVALCLVDQQH